MLAESGWETAERQARIDLMARLIARGATRPAVMEAVAESTGLDYRAAKRRADRMGARARA